VNYLDIPTVIRYRVPRATEGYYRALLGDFLARVHAGDLVWR
jgi:hypothetical protein